MSNQSAEKINRRIRACNYLTVAQLYLKDNFLLDQPLAPSDLKPRLLGHWGTCPGINTVYANLKAFYQDALKFILGPGHGFPALQANLFLDGDLAQVDPQAQPTYDGLRYICRDFSWPGGFPSHASPVTPGVVCEGGELGYALATAYGQALAQPEKTITVLIGDGEFETATALASLNLNHILKSRTRVLPILHLNGYKISGPTLAARKSGRELNQLLRGFAYEPLHVRDGNPDAFQETLKEAETLLSAKKSPFIVFTSEKGATGPTSLGGQKIAGNYLSHQIPLPNVATDEKELKLLESWLLSYNFLDVFNKHKGFTI